MWKRQAARAHKYKAVKTVVDGITFPSKKEASRYSQLKLLERAGKISNLVVTGKAKRFSLVVNGIKICDYIADFLYTENGQPVVEDVKGMRTREYKLKKKLMLACHGIEIRET